MASHIKTFLTTWSKERASLALLVSVGLAGAGQYLLLQRQEMRGWLFYLTGAAGLLLAQSFSTGGREAEGRSAVAVSPRVGAAAILIVGQVLAMYFARTERLIWLPAGAWIISLIALVVLLARRDLAWPAPAWRPRWRPPATTPEWLGVAGLTLLAAGLRLPNLDSLPNGVHGDEGEFGELARAVLQGDGPPPFDVAFWGESSFYVHLLAGLMAVVGENLTAIRLLSALAGIAMVPALYLLVRDLFGRRAAFIAAFLLATSAVYIHFSRLALNIVHGPLFFCLSLWCLWRGFASQSRLWLVMGGVTGGLALLFSFGARLIVPVLAFVLIWRLLLERSAWRRWLTESALVALGGFLALSPQLAGSWYDRTKLVGRTESRLIWFDSANWAATAERHGADSTEVLRILAGLVLTSLSAFTHRRDVDDFYPFDGVALTPGVVAPFVLLGLVFTISRMRDLRYAIVAGWFVMPFVVGSVLTIGSGSFHRLLPAVIPGLVAAAIFVDYLIRTVQVRVVPSVGAVSTAALVLLLLLGGLQDVQTYLGRTGVSYPWPVATAQARFAGRLEPGGVLLSAGAPDLYASHGPTRFLGRRLAERQDLVNPTVTLPLSPREHQVGLFLPEGRKEWLPLLQAYYPTAAVATLQAPPDRTLAYTIVLSHQDQLAAVRPEGGLLGAVIDGAQPPALTANARRDPAIVFRRLRALTMTDTFSGRWAGALVVPREGEYELEVLTDGQVTVRLDGQVVIAERTAGGLRALRHRLLLRAGAHPLELVGHWQGREGTLELYWRPPNAERQLVPPQALRPPAT